MAMLGANASKPAKRSPRTMISSWATILRSTCAGFFCWLRLRLRAAGVGLQDVKSLAEVFAEPLSPSREPKDSPLQIDRDALPLRITVEHAFERVLAADTTLLV